MSSKSSENKSLEDVSCAPTLESIIEIVSDLEAISRSIIDPLCKKYGLNKLSMFILMNLESLPDQNPSRLSTVLHAKRTNIASTLRNLEYKGLVSIGASTEDKRNRLVNLTDSGHEITQAISKDLETSRADLVNRLPPEDTQELLQAWNTFRNSVVRIAQELNLRN